MSKFVHIDEDKLVSFDCDDTLVMWNEEKGHQQPYAGALEFDLWDSKVYLTPHHKHIKKLIGYKRAGYKVIVWSMGGNAWAREVVRVLQLEDHVDLIMSKPSILYDDMPLNEAFGRRKYYLPKKD